jgi:hypothetical protein
MRMKDILGWSIIFALALLISAGAILSAPAGVQFTYNQTLNFTPRPAATLTTAGGSFTTMNLNISGQTPRWKAYVGNVTGVVTLDDASGKSIYDWTPSIITGEIYATRNASPTWTSIACADNDSVSAENTALNITATKPDAINATFTNQTHRGFYVGTISIPANNCLAIATYVNDTRSTLTEESPFQEILLSDASSLVYATLIENNKYGFNNMVYDFQMILPNDEFSTAPTTYYFFAEIG